MTLVTWLLGLVGPQTAFALLLAHMQTGYSGLPPTVLNLCGLAGMPDALGLIWGAFNARLAIWVTLNSTKWVVSK
jgi:hypothetical protein